METMNEGNIVDIYPPVKENIAGGIFGSVVSILGEDLHSGNKGNELIWAVVKLSSTFFEEQQRHPMIATMSSMLEQWGCRYPVKGIGSPILYDSFEYTLNLLTAQGFARMLFEEELK